MHSLRNWWEMAVVGEKKQQKKNPDCWFIPLGQGFQQGLWKVSNSGQPSSQPRVSDCVACRNRTKGESVWMHDRDSIRALWTVCLRQGPEAPFTLSTLVLGAQSTCCSWSTSRVFAEKNIFFYIKWAGEVESHQQALEIKTLPFPWTEFCF